MPLWLPLNSTATFFIIFIIFTACLSNGVVRANHSVKLRWSKG